MTFLTLLAALLLSGIAAYYSVIGLATIFVGAFWPVVFMGSSLEFAKVVTASWLYRNWDKAPVLLKSYLTIAVAILMLITSMGIFGFLSKAHLEQSAEMAPLVNKVALYNEKIKVEKENIDANRKALKQLDEAVDQVMGRSTDEKGADKAVALRKTQQKERSRLLAENQESQRKVASLSEEVAPLTIELQKVESDFGPIKYVAELIYGSGERDLIDKAVRLVIMLIMLVFDPLAVLLLIAANMSMKQTKDNNEDSDPDVKSWFERARQRAKFWDKQKKEEVNPVVVTVPDIEQIKEIKEDVPIKTNVEFEGVRVPGQDEWVQTGPAFVVTTPTYPNISNQHEQVEVHHIQPGLYEEHKVPVKKLEPKYDYDDPYAFREKENK